jgi:pimeloyl-ACP methyl ester carboxylesterase
MCDLIWGAVKRLQNKFDLTPPLAYVIVSGGKCGLKKSRPIEDGRWKTWEAENAHLADSVTMMCNGSWKRVRAWTAVTAAGVALDTPFVSLVRDTVRSKLEQGFEVVLFGFSYGGSVAGLVAEMLRGHPRTPYLHVRAVSPLRIPRDTGAIDVVNYIGVVDKLAQKWAGVEPSEHVLRELSFPVANTLQDIDYLAIRNPEDPAVRRRYFVEDKARRVVWFPNYMQMHGQAYDTHGDVHMFFALIDAKDRNRTPGHLCAVDRYFLGGKNVTYTFHLSEKALASYDATREHEKKVEWMTSKLYDAMEAIFPDDIEEFVRFALSQKGVVRHLNKLSFTKAMLVEYVNLLVIGGAVSDFMSDRGSSDSAELVKAVSVAAARAEEVARDDSDSLRDAVKYVVSNMMMQDSEDDELSEEELAQAEDVTNDVLDDTEFARKLGAIDDEGVFTQMVVERVMIKLAEA